MGEKKRIDVGFPMGVDENGHPRLLRFAGEEGGPLEVRAGSLQPLEDGKPIYGEVVGLKARSVGSGYDIEVVAGTSGTAQRELSGPAQVATESYRTGWERAFGERLSKQFLN